MINLDTRHWAWCSLGPLAEEPSTIADSHVQGAGFVKTTGTINLRGIFRPAAGSEVALAYSDGQRWIARLPRRLRVLSSLADPLRGITTVSVGCSLAYFEDRKPAIRNITNVEANPGLSDLERRIAAQSISAAFVVGQILQTLGLTAAGSIPFTTSRIVDEWDLSAGYVEELGRIAQSEGYFAWINEAGQVAFIKKAGEIGAGPLVTQTEIIDLTPQTVGDLPAESVYARFERLRLVPPDANPTDDAIARRNWEKERIVGGSVQAINTYTDSAGNQVKEYKTFIDIKETTTTYDGRDRVRQRRDWQQGLLGNSVGTTTFTYASGVSTSTANDAADDTDYTEVVSEEFVQTSPIGDIAAACGKNGPISELRMGEGTTLTRTTIYDKAPVSGITKTTTYQQVSYINTPFGSDAISKLRDTDESFDNILVAARRLTPYGSNVRIRTEREFGLQRRPSQQERNRMADAKAPSVEQTAEIVWAIGSPAAQTTLELSPPYVSDDRIAKQGAAYVVTPSDAEQRAEDYAEIENRLLLANRAGPGVQLLPIDMPAAPFAPLYVRLNGATAACRVNGATWTISPSGVVVSSDLLFWGAVDGTLANAWFPLPPGTTSLPATAAVTTNANPLPPNAMAIPVGFNPMAPNLTTLFAALPSGVAPVPQATINPSVVVPPYHQTTILRRGALLGRGFTERDWVPETRVIGRGVKVGRELVTLFSAGGGSFDITGRPLPVLKASAGTFDATGEDAQFGMWNRLDADAGVVDVIGSDADFTLVYSDPFMPQTEALLPMSGPNNSTTFTDLSLFARTVNVFGNAKITTSTGVEAGTFDADGDFLQMLVTSPGTGDFTLEAYVRPQFVPDQSEAFHAIMSFVGDADYAGTLYWQAGAIFFEGLTGQYGRTALGGSVSTTQYTHIEACRASGILRLFVGGAQLLEGSTPAQYSLSDNYNSGILRFGRPGVDGDYYNGFMRWARYTRAARHTTGFTPPAIPYI